MRGCAALLIACTACASWQRSIEVDHATGVSLHVAKSSAVHDHPAAVSVDDVRGALLKDGNFVDADIARVAAAMAKEFGVLKPQERLVISGQADEWHLFVEQGQLVVVRGGDGPRTSYRLGPAGSALTASTNPSQAPTIAMTDWKVSGLNESAANALLERFAAQLAADGGLKVTTPRDMAQALGNERQRQLLGCAEETGSCLAELAGALGADGTLLGSVVKIGDSYTVTIRAVGSATGRELVSISSRVKGDEQLQDWLDNQARELARRIIAALRTKG